MNYTMNYIVIFPAQNKKPQIFPDYCWVNDRAKSIDRLPRATNDNGPRARN